MAKYAYPAIFTAESDGSYSINFPDLEGCYTCGDDLNDGMEMTKTKLLKRLLLFQNGSMKRLLLLASTSLKFFKKL